MVGVWIKFKVLTVIPSGFRILIDSEGNIVKDSLNRIVIAR